MSENDDWRWINKALQKLIRYDLSDAEIGLVTYTDVSDVEYNMTKLKDDRVNKLFKFCLNLDCLVFNQKWEVAGER